MARAERMDFNGKTSRIIGTAEQEFFRFVQEKLPGVKIAYEATSFTVTDGNGTARSTKPDFRIEKSGRETFVEITTAEINGSHPKATQMRIMRNFPDVRYVVLTRENLEHIQQAHPDTSFFKKDQKI